MDLRLTGHTALVTGASAGIGRGVAKQLALEGVKVAITARRESLLADLAGEIEAAGGPSPVIMGADLAAPGAPNRVAAEALKHLQHVDILVNSAGGSRPLQLGAPDATWEEAMNIDYTAIRRLTHCLLPSMQDRRWGRIINITGSSEPRALNGAGPAKAAVHAWAKGLSRVLGPYGITVNSIAPGRIMSEQIVRMHPTPEDREQYSRQHIPLGYFGEPEDVAGLVAFLASEQGRYITGVLIHVDGGSRLFAF